MASLSPPPTPVNLLQALDPARNVVVEACAGSGKTWLLVSRMIRLLLAGAAPSELLAITFTRKAAEEMKDRLYRWLELLAVAGDDEAVAFLVERGLSPAAARAALPVARGLFERVLMEPVGPVITTFHGWFFHLLARAPITARTPTRVLADAALRLREAWLTYAESLRRQSGQPGEAAFRSLLTELNLHGTQALLQGFVARRAEWWAWAAGRVDPVADCVAELEALAGVDEAEDVAAGLLAEPELDGLLHEYLELLTLNGTGAKKAAARAATLAEALAQTDTQARFFGLCAALLKQDGQPFADYQAGKALDGRLTPAGAGRFLELHALLAGRVAETRARLEEQRALRLHRCGLTAGLGLLEQYQRLKAEQDGLDFTGAEWEAWRLLSDEGLAPALLAKLDARWKHILLDEFQDTNPLQWQILRAWLAAYGADGERPTLFLVGDPKQSIYRFRRAEPRLFAEARDWLLHDWQALHVPTDLTRRLAPRVAAWVNGVFDGLEVYPEFRRHTVYQTDLPGGCEILLAERGRADDAPPGSPLSKRGGGGIDSASGVQASSEYPPTPLWERGEKEGSQLRDPLHEPPPDEPEPRADEARRVAERILAMVGRLAVRDGGGERPARWSDIYLLAASRTGLDAFEQALRAAGIPYVTGRRGGLLATLEAADLMALLTWLTTPHADLALAQVLRCPVFAWTDDDLLCLVDRAERWADRAEPAWVDRLAGWAAETDAPAHVRHTWDRLAGWQRLAGRVPAHDLLDRIFHEGEVEARYAAAVPAHLRAGVLANLRALLALSLEFSGGRYPSLPRFLDELRSLRDRAGDEAPDEPPAAAGDCVRLLTIHAAKGLEAPIVFLLKADEKERDREHYGVLLDWPADAERPGHFSLFGPQALRGRAREALFDKEKALRSLERLNLLYVAMTRARQVLVVSGLDDAAEGTWLDLAGKGLARAQLDGLPEVEETAVAPGPTEPVVQPHPEEAPVPPLGTLRPPDSAEAALGVLVHRYLELAAEGWLEADIRHDLDCGEARFERVRGQARALLDAPGLRRFFDPAAYLNALNELEFVAADGSLRRIDRLVEFSDAVWVLDFKTGGLEEPDPARRAAPHLGQLLAYRQAVAQLYPGRPVRTALLFVDGLFHEVTESDVACAVRT